MPSFIKNASIKLQVLLAFGFVFAATAGLGLVANDRLGAVNDQAADVRNNWLPSTGVDGLLIQSIGHYWQRQLRYALVDQTARAGVMTQMKEAGANVAKYRKLYEPMIVRGTRDEE